MKIDIINWNSQAGWALNKQSIKDKSKAQLIIFFAAPEFYKNKTSCSFLSENYPNAQIIGCSTGGEILKSEVLDGTLVATAIEFANTQFEIAMVNLKDGCDSKLAGNKIAEKLKKEGLRHVYVLSDGTKVNGSELIGGLFEKLPDGVTVTGGLAGDGPDFGKTFVTVNDLSDDQMIAAIGFYGDAINIGYGSMGGWDAFGPDRTITKAKNNILYELDNRPALQLYKSYLGEEANDLPGSGLLYPLSVRDSKESNQYVVRTIVGIDEANQSLIFAGDIHEGCIARLMKGDFNNLVDGAMHAAIKAKGDIDNGSGLALLVSCIGRKLLMGQRVSDETDIIKEIFGSVPIIGFYSYGEICHHSFTNKCDLHNQTMTVTYITETV